MVGVKGKVTIIRRKLIKAAASRPILPRQPSRQEKGRMIEQILTADHETFKILAKK